MNYHDKKCQLLCDDFILIDSCLNTKQGIFFKFAEMLNKKNRLISESDFQDALIDREKVYSTNLGDGFSVPHLKSEKIRGSAIAVIRLNKEIVWDADIESAKVNTVVLFALNSNTIEKDMPVFAQLARNLMDDTFRMQLQRMSSASKLHLFLRKELALPPFNLPKNGRK